MIKFNRYITNDYKDGDVHLAIYNIKRLQELRKYFSGIPQNLSSGNKFCMVGQGYAGRSSGYRYSEDPSVATCPLCLEMAKNWNYGVIDSHVEKNGKFLLSNFSVEKITQWIPPNCSIIISSKSIKVKDEITKEELDVKDIFSASALIAEKCFEPFSSEEAAFNKDILKENIYDIHNAKFIIQGLNYDTKNNIFDGFILRGLKGNNIVSNMTFQQMFNSGFHFESGMPCGSYIKNRKPFVTTEVSENLGVVVPDVKSDEKVKKKTKSDNIDINFMDLSFNEDI